MNRRQFVGSLSAGAAALAIGSSLELEGCNAASVWKDIETWLPAGISSFEAIVTLVAPLAAPGIDAIAETVKAAFAVLSGAVDSYINAPAADKATWLQRVELAFNDVTTEHPAVPYGHRADGQPYREARFGSRADHPVHHRLVHQPDWPRTGTCDAQGGRRIGYRWYQSPATAKPL